jgi:hypothetical protein
VSRSRRIPLAREDFYTRHPHRLQAAHKRGDLDFYEAGILSFLVDEIDLGRTGDVSYTLSGLVEALAWPLTPESLRLKLHRLRAEGWIDFDDVTPGQRRPWTFRLARAAIDGETSSEPPNDLQTETPSDLEVTSKEPMLEEAETPLTESDSSTTRPPSAPTPRAEPSRAEPREDHSPKDDHLLGKTTDTPDVESDPFLDAFEAVNGRGPVDDVHEAIEHAQRAQSRASR